MIRQALVRLGLRFPEEARERLFVESLVRAHLRTTQLFLAAVVVLFGSFTLWDRTVDPLGWPKVFFLREFVLTPILGAAAVALLFRRFWPYLEIIVSVAMTTMLAGFTVICAQLDHGFQYGAAGLLLIYFGGAAIFPLRVIFLVLPSAVSLIGFLGVEALGHHAAGDMMIVNALCIVTAVIIVGLSGAGRELAARREFRTDLALESSRARVDDLLHSMMPREIVDRIQAGETTIADIHGEVSIVFADLVGFTAMSRRLTASQLVEMLNKVFSRFDTAAGALGIEKIKTIGDAYMAVGGLATGEQAYEHAGRMAQFALAMRDVTRDLAAELGLPIAIRIGLHVGPIVAGVIGIKRPAFDCWGDAVNVASRLEHASGPGGILISEAAFERLRDRFEVEAAPAVELKGIGLSNVYFLHGPLAAGAAAAA